MAVLDNDLLIVLNMLADAVNEVLDTKSDIVEGLNLVVNLGVKSYGDTVATYYEEGWQV